MADLLAQLLEPREQQRVDERQHGEVDQPGQHRALRMIAGERPSPKSDPRARKTHMRAMPPMRQTPDTIARPWRTSWTFFAPSSGACSITAAQARKNSA